MTLESEELNDNEDYSGLSLSLDSPRLYQTLICSKNEYKAVTFCSAKHQTS